MANAVATLTRPGSTVRPVHSYKLSNQKVVIRDYTLDTGNYTQGGLTITAASVGMKAFNFVTTAGTIANSGTAGATGNPVSILFNTEGTSITVQLYEAAATGLALLEKTDAEAVASNFTIRIKFEGI